MAKGPPPWRVLIADDEPAARLGVRQLLRPYPEFMVAAECRNGKEVLKALESEEVDAIFLDIQMPELGGFEVIRVRRPDAMPAVVFLTAYDRFAVGAFEVEALDYLVKPVSEKRFASTVERLRRHLGQLRERGRKLTASLGRDTVVLDLDQVEWVESADNYAKLWVAGKGYLVRRPLHELEQQLESQGFLRAHRQALVRLDAVRRLVAKAEGELAAQLASGAEIPIARRRRAAFAAALRGELP
jgi:two-component system LytT family response regulator